MRYIKFIILSVIGAIVLFGCTGKTEQAKAKYVFYFIGDGMGVNQVIGTEMYLAELEGRIGTKSLSFTSFPVRNYLTTYFRYECRNLFGCCRNCVGRRNKNTKRAHRDEAG